MKRSRVPLGESKGPSPHRAPADQVVGAGVAHQRPQLAEEGRHGAGARLRGQRGWRCLHGAVSAGLSAPPRRRGLVKAAESAVFATRPALLRLPARGQVGATCEPAGRGSNRGAAPPDRKGSWDPMFVKKCSGGRRPEFEFHPSQARRFPRGSSGETARARPDVGWESPRRRCRRHNEVWARASREEQGRKGAEKQTPSRRTLWRCHFKDAECTAPTPVAALVHQIWRSPSLTSLPRRLFPPPPSLSRADRVFHRTERHCRIYFTLTSEA